MLRCGLVVAWVDAWRAGLVGADSVLDAIQGEDAPHRAGDGSLLPVLLRVREAQPRLVLPVAGDVRGLPGPAPFRHAALEAGEAVVAGPLGLVPSVLDIAATSAPASVRWDAFDVEPAPPDPQSVAQAQYELGEAIRACARELAAAEVAGRADPAALASARRAGERLDLPPGHPPRAVALLAQAQRLQAVLNLAAADPVGGAHDGHGARLREQALRPLATAVRRARLAGFNAAHERNARET